MEDWISVNKELPRLNVDVLVYTKSGKIMQDRRVTGICELACWYEVENITHWMPLPSAPIK